VHRIGHRLVLGVGATRLSSAIRASSAVEQPVNAKITIISFVMGGALGGNEKVGRSRPRYY